jgi:ubiquinone/menaquinone biosynthesis C-methylase UbiE
MKWHVGDMTAMPEYANAAYDVVFDKGALDALMSEDTADVASKAQTMFLEISRILSEGGRYVCITLAESYILKSLLGHFTALNYTITVESVQGGKPSPFKPFYITITKQTRRTGVTGDVTLLVDCLGNDAQGRRVTLAAAMEQVRHLV